jgi:hypothetical protein
MGCEAGRRLAPIIDCEGHSRAGYDSKVAVGMDGIGENPTGEVHAKSMIEGLIIDRCQDLENW